MCRPALLSEVAIFKSACTDLGLSLRGSVNALKESYYGPRVVKSKQFNGDFSVWFAPELPVRANRLTAVIPVHPRSMGAEVFVTLSNAGEPILMELSGGDSIPLTSFLHCEKIIGPTIERAIGTPCRGASYLRIIELTEGIAFLAASNTNDLLTLRAAHCDRKTNGQMEYTAYSFKEKVLVIDGFFEY